MGIAANAQSDDCSSLLVYADSLESLNLAHEERKVLGIADSLIMLHGRKKCQELIRIKAAKANAHELLLDFETPLTIYNSILDQSIDKGYIREEIWIRLSIARVYEWIGRKDQCEEKLEEAKALLDIHGYPDILSRYYVRYSSFIRIFNKDLIAAKEYARKGMELGKKHGVLRSVADGYLMMGVTTSPVNWEESISYFSNASNVFMVLGDEEGAFAQKANVASNYITNGKYEKGLEILHEVDSFAYSNSDNEKLFYSWVSYNANIKAQAYEGLGLKDSVIKELKLQNEYTKLFGDLVNQEKINDLILENAISQEQDKANSANRLNKILGVVLIGLGGIVILLARMYRLNRIRKQQIEQQSFTIQDQYNELEKVNTYQTTLLSEVHHRIKNNLQLIISLLTLQKAKLGNDIDTNVLDMLNQRIRSISLIHEQLYNFKEFDRLDVNFYAEDLLKNFNALTVGQNIIIRHEIDDIKLNLETVTPLGLIWSELISNSIKYNEQREDLEIFFDLIKIDNGYTMHYYDNGIGYPEGEFSSNPLGMGFTIIQSLSRQLSARTSAYNDNGAHFTLVFQEKTVSPI